jgi:hypothetical protein
MLHDPFEGWGLRIVPITFRAARAYVQRVHRHHEAPRGHKFSVGLQLGDQLVGVAMAGRPVSRHLDNGLTLEVNRTCTDGTANANSMLYGACRRTAWGMGYRRLITYTQTGESGASLHASGFIKVKDLPKRGSWADSSQKLKTIRNPVGTGGVARILWEIMRYD